MPRIGWTGRAVIGGLLAVGVAGLSRMFPLALLGQGLVYLVLPLAGWYCFFRLLGAPLSRTEKSLTGLGTSSGPRIVCAVLSVGASLVWLWLEPQNPATALVFVVLTAIPLAALAWRLAGTAVTLSRTWFRRVTAAAIILVVPHLALPASPGHTDHYFHWLRYQRIVADVRADGLKPGDCRRYTMRAPYLYMYLETRPDEKDSTDESLSRTGEVQAFMNPDGRLVVSIITADYHHAGKFGYLFADDRRDLDRDGCLRVLGNTTRNKLNRNWETFRWD
jgi:hypothetical protein